MDKYEYFWTITKNDYINTDFITCKEDIKSLYFMDEKELVKTAKLGKKAAAYIIEKKAKLDIEKEYDFYLESGIKSVCFYDDNYPKKLLNIQDRPFALFYIGDLPREDHFQVAIVGARECSEYGRYMTSLISSGLAQYDVEIVSGMAVGIDGIAGMSALDSGARSYAVLGCGVDSCYPRANKMLYERLKKCGGVISEYPLKEGALAAHFPKRNRIISGLSDVVIVVEAREKSGTLITVDYALEQGKEIMIVPGRATDPLSVGCNSLIKAGAYPVQNAEDVIEVLSRMSGYCFCEDRENKNSRQNKTLDLTKEENVLFSLLDFYPKDVAELINTSRYDLLKVEKILMSLELKGYIKEVSKGMFARLT